LNYPAQPTNQAGWADGVMPGADNSDQDKPASHQSDLTPAKEIKKQRDGQMLQDARRIKTTNEKEHKIAVRDYIILE